MTKRGDSEPRWWRWGPRCSFCGATAGPFLEVEGAFRLLMCGDCQVARGHNPSPYPTLTRPTVDSG